MIFEINTFQYSKISSKTYACEISFVRAINFQIQMNSMTKFKG